MDDYKNFESVLQKVNNFITLKKPDRFAYTNDFNRVRDFLLHEMIAIDKNFGAMCKGPCLAGSYADNLKVYKPDEFDLVIHMRAPDQQLIDVRQDPQRPGNVLINLNSLLKKIRTERHNENLYCQLYRLVNYDGYLVQAKFQSWIESLVTRVIMKCSNTFQCNNMVYRLHYVKQGPAHTIEVKQGTKSFSIDFVPGLLFDQSKWPGQRKCPSYASYTNWIAIGKPIFSRYENLSFQASFVDTEREIIHGKNNFKNSLRMFKKMRDRLNIQNMKSYYIKTVFLWETDDKPDIFWSVNSLSNIFLNMFEKILSMLASENLSFFWDKDCNMLSNLRDDQKKTMYGQWKAAYLICLKFKDSNPERIFDLFLTHDEKCSMLPVQEVEESSRCIIL